MPRDFGFSLALLAIWAAHCRVSICLYFYVRQDAKGWECAEDNTTSINKTLPHHHILRDRIRFYELRTPMFLEARGEWLK